MAPFYRGYDENPALDADDVRAIQDLYGPPTFRAGLSAAGATVEKPVLTTTTRRRTSSRQPWFFDEKKPDICDSAIIDAMTTTNDGHTHAFKGEWYYQLNDYGVEAGYPRKITKDWDGLPNNIDAALTWADGKTFFFKVSLQEKIFISHNIRIEKSKKRCLEQKFCVSWHKKKILSFA